MSTFKFATTSPAETDVETLVLPVFEGPEGGPGVREVSGPLGGDLVAAYRDAKLTGKLGEVLAVPTMGRLRASTIFLVGLGRQADVTADTVRRAMGKVAGRVAKFRSAATTLPQVAGRRPEEATLAAAEGLSLGAYRFDRYKSDNGRADGDSAALRNVTLLGRDRWDASSVRDALRRAEIVADSVAWARDLVNTPAGDATPDYLAREAQRMAREAGLKVKIWKEQELERGGFGGILGVGQGSTNPPRMIELRYDGGSGAPIALTGKGVTFDSGGLSIKDAKGMEWMKADMGGAAGMLGAMRAIGLLKPRINVIAAIPSSENLPSGSAVRPGDVLVHRGGKTSEVLNTDAEGRLILADSLAYLTEQNPRVIIDAATLTGACMVALGDQIWGVMGNDRRVIADLLAAGEAVGEPGWELPLWDGYRKQIDSTVADVKNIGDGRWAGAIVAALFLREFVGDIPWCHMDVAGTAYAERPGDYWPKGGTGSPVRTVVRYVLDRAAEEGQSSGSARGRSRASRSGNGGAPRARKRTSARRG